MQTGEAVKEIAAELLKYEVSLHLDHYSEQQLFDALVKFINELIAYNFSKLVFILYRLDIPEKKLMKVLGEERNKTAGETIAEMIIERQKQKIESRKKFSGSAEGIPDDEKW